MASEAPAIGLEASAELIRSMAGAIPSAGATNGGGSAGSSVRMRSAAWQADAVSAAGSGATTTTTAATALMSVVSSAAAAARVSAVTMTSGDPAAADRLSAPCGSASSSRSIAGSRCPFIVFQVCTQAFR
jgi:hypothetical protein